MTVEYVEVSEKDRRTPQVILHNMKGWNTVLGHYKMPVEEMVTVIDALNKVTPVEVNSNEGNLICPSCENKLSNEDNYCSKCGQRVVIK